MASHIIWLKYSTLGKKKYRVLVLGPKISKYNVESRYFIDVQWGITQFPYFLLQKMRLRLHKKAKFIKTVDHCYLEQM